jgi:energy-coupling factor transporter ATP-binding protein EcfA2
MQKIWNFEVLNLPPRNWNIHWEIWHKLNAQENNLLLAWDNWSGKSTMLQILHESLERWENVWLWRVKWENVVGIFIEICEQIRKFSKTDSDLLLRSWYSHSDLTHNKSELDDVSTEKLNIALWEAIETLQKNIFWWWIKNIWDTSFACTEWQLFSGFSDSFYRSKYNYREYEDINHEEMITLFIRGISAYARKHNLPEEMVYWNFLFLSAWIHSGQSQGWSKWGYIKPFVQDESKLLQAEKFIFSDKEDKWELSQWEHTKKRMDELFELVDQTSTWVIAFLDEPTNWLSRSAKKELLDILDKPNEKLQIFAASHDWDFQAMVFSQNTTWNWYDLDEWMSSTELYMKEG